MYVYIYIHKYVQIFIYLCLYTYIYISQYVKIYKVVLVLTPETDILPLTIFCTFKIWVPIAVRHKFPQGFNAADLFPPEMLSDTERCNCALTAVLCDLVLVDRDFHVWFGTINWSIIHKKKRVGSQITGFSGQCSGEVQTKLKQSIYPKKVNSPRWISLSWPGGIPWLFAAKRREPCMGIFGDSTLLVSLHFLKIFSTLVSVCGAFIKNYSSNTSVFFPEPQKTTKVLATQTPDFQQEAHVFPTPKVQHFNVLFCPEKGCKGWFSVKSSLFTDGNCYKGITSKVRTKSESQQPK